MLYQILARDWLLRMAATGQRAAHLDEVPDQELDRLALDGFHWLYLLGIWQTDAASRQVSRANPAWQAGYRAALSDFSEEDACGSPFAVSAYRVHTDFGGDDALAKLRASLKARGIKLMLDFVPNHLGLDHEWIAPHPERFIRGTSEDLEREPDNFVQCGNQILARGRDPYFPGWTDTVQLDYSQDDTRVAMSAELERIAGQCDGVRCDMAMLILPEIFRRTWNRQMQPFWPTAIQQARRRNSAFTTVAEVYWGLEWELQQQGFDFTYDKTLYDRLIHGDAGDIRAHLRADTDFQRKMVHFLENHDEARVAAELSFDRHRAAALISYLIPGLQFFHDGQLEGARRRPSIHLRRREREAVDPEIAGFYKTLLAQLRSGDATGDWKLLESLPAWAGNPTADSIIGFCRLSQDRIRLLVAVNFADHRSQGYLRTAREHWAGPWVEFRDALDGVLYQRSADDLADRGLYIDLPAWGAHVLHVVGKG